MAKILKKISILILFICLYSSCKKSEVVEELKKDTLDGKPYKIELTSDKSTSTTGVTIKANNIEEVTLKVKVTDINGTIVNETCKMMLNGNTFNGTSFKTATTGDYVFQASFGTLVSNTYTIKANESLEGKPYKIELTSDKVSLGTTGLIKAYGIEEAVLKTKVTDIYGTVLNENCSLTINGTPFSGNSFKTTTPGNYVFQASIGSIKSNTFTIVAHEIAEKYISLEDSWITSINSVGLVTVAIKFKNISSKRLKYASFDVSCYNNVNDAIKEEINGRYSITGQGTGFYEPNTTYTIYFQIGYFTGTKSIKVKISSVTLEDGKNIFPE